MTILEKIPRYVTKNRRIKRNTQNFISIICFIKKPYFSQYIITKRVDDKGKMCYQILEMKSIYPI